MVVAYAAARAVAPGHLVLYLVGEFYEVLGDDAATVSRLLGIQLTRRRQKDAPDIPMCGISAGAAEAAIARLLAAGRKVAVSEQPAEPAGERPLRLMTPGTSVDAAVLAAGRPNTLAVAHVEGEAVALAWTDLSTGEAGTCMASLGGCAAALARIVPSEILVSRWPDGSEALALAVRGSGARFSDLPGDSLRPDEADAVLARAYGPGWREALRGFSPLELTTQAALLDYVRRVVGTLPAGLPLPRRVSAGDTVEIDGPTLRGLDVLASGSGRDGSLLSVMDRTVTAPGTRLLVRQLSAPLRSGAGSPWSGASSATRHCAPTAATCSGACRTSCAPAGGCRSARPARATSPPCATALTARPSLPASWGQPAICRQGSRPSHGISGQLRPDPAVPWPARSGARSRPILRCP